MKKGKISVVLFFTMLFSMSILMAVLISGCGGSESGTDDEATVNEDAPVIALSNSYYGNTWRKQMVDSFEAAAEQAKADGLISDYIVVNGDNTVNTQISQLNDLILKGVDVICVDAASPTALNGTIQEALKAGITVISFDSVVTEEDAYKLDFDFVNEGVTMAEYMVDRLDGKGNILLVRGIAGSTPDAGYYEGWTSVLDQYPDIKIVGEVYGEFTTSTAETKVSAILPSLPEIDAVLCSGGGDDWGVVQAFQSSSQDMPIIDGKGSAEFISWWYTEYQNNDYETMSISTSPSVGAAAFWVGVNLMQGKEAPNYMVAPDVVINLDNLSEFASIEPNTIADKNFGNDWVLENIFNQ